MGKPLRKTVWRFLKKLTINLPYDSAIPVLGMYLGKTIIQIGTCTPMFTAELLTIARTWKQPKCPSPEEWIKKMQCTHTHTPPTHKNEIMPFAATQRISKLQYQVKSLREEQISHHLHVESNQNKLIYKTETNSQISKSN